MSVQLPDPSIVKLENQRNWAIGGAAVGAIAAVVSAVVLGADWSHLSNTHNHISAWATGSVMVAGFVFTIVCAVRAHNKSKEISIKKAELEENRLKLGKVIFEVIPTPVIKEVESQNPLSNQSSFAANTSQPTANTVPTPSAPPLETTVAKPQNRAVAHNNDTSPTAPLIDSPLPAPPPVTKDVIAQTQAVTHNDPLPIAPLAATTSAPTNINPPSPIPPPVTTNGVMPQNLLPNPTPLAVITSQPPVNIDPQPPTSPPETIVVKPQTQSPVLIPDPLPNQSTSTVTTVVVATSQQPTTVPNSQSSKQIMQIPPPANLSAQATAPLIKPKLKSLKSYMRQLDTLVQGGPSKAQQIGDFFNNMPNETFRKFQTYYATVTDEGSTDDAMQADQNLNLPEGHYLNVMDYPKYDYVVEAIKRRAGN